MNKWHKFVTAFVIVLVGLALFSFGAQAQDDEDSTDVFMEDSVSFTGVEEAEEFCVNKTIEGVRYERDDCVKRMEILNDGGQPLVAHLEDGPAVAVKIPDGYFAQLWACKTSKDLPYYVVGPSLIHRACQMSVRKYDIYSGEIPDPDSYVFVPPIGADNGDSNDSQDEDSNTGDDSDEQSDNSAASCDVDQLVEQIGGSGWTSTGETGGMHSDESFGSFTAPEDSIVDHNAGRSLSGETVPASNGLTVYCS